MEIVNTQRNYSNLSLNLAAVLKNSTPGKFTYIWHFNGTKVWKKHEFISIRNKDIYCAVVVAKCLHFHKRSKISSPPLNVPQLRLSCSSVTTKTFLLIIAYKKSFKWWMKKRREWTRIRLGRDGGEECWFPRFFEGPVYEYWPIRGNSPGSSREFTPPLGGKKIMAFII